MTFKLLPEWLSNSFNLEKGIIQTFISLQLHPGRLSSDFFSGKTKTYFNPISYFLITISIGFFVDDGTGYYLLFIPLSLLIGLIYRLVFYNEGLNLFQHLILSLFLCSQIIILWIIIFYLDKTLQIPRIIGIGVIFAIVYIFYFNWDVFSSSNRLFLLFKTLLAWVLIILGMWGFKELVDMIMIFAKIA